MHEQPARELRSVVIPDLRPLPERGDGVQYRRMYETALVQLEGQGRALWWPRPARSRRTLTVTVVGKRPALIAHGLGDLRRRIGPIWDAALDLGFVTADSDLLVLPAQGPPAIVVTLGSPLGTP